MDKLIENLDFGAEGLWFPITISILLSIIVLFIPKRNITWREIYITIGIVGFATWISDAVIARTLDLIDLGDPNKTGIGEIFCYTLIPTSFSILYLNYLSKENKWKITILFIVLSFLVEAGMLYFGYMKYNGWNLAFSFIAFVIAFGFLLPLHSKIIKM
ncbi:hypothetical protein [Metabacillus endolithicus]|uniref:Uncharacterized protein n=1 Tax=Metabacillus endolithicus TaxID=1535204 RepID=A0ABW5C0F1_9BACI|nr:hypothetical protein [Metabacillus endolithicus]UPG62583.1 hypothetical protein MVE64_19235 [Metabacillus endolithicus]